MIILRLFSLFFTLCGLAVAVAAVWLLMGNKLVVPDSDVFGDLPDPVRQTVPGIVQPERSFQPSSRRLPSPGDQSFTSQSMPRPDSLQQTMRSVPIAYEAPPRAQFARPFTVTVVVDATGEGDGTEALPGSGQQVADTAEVTDRVQVSVAGDAFGVEPLSPAIQRLSDQTENIWRFRAVARDPGDQPLAIEIFALDGADALPVRTYRGTVTVEITRVGQAVALAESLNPVVVLLGGIGSALAGFFGFVRFFSGRRRQHA